ncbi:MAG: cation transporter [Magnetococcales bacterium]|nr:cation transporter [Magnetococcales bacterium]
MNRLDTNGQPPRTTSNPTTAEIKEARFEASKKVTYMGVLLDALLTLIKIFAGVMGHSAAMIAEGLHSSTDLISDFAILIGLHMAKKDADADHPYGHGKYEAVATLFLALALIGVALGIVLDAAHRIHDENLPTPEMIALYVALFSIVAKEVMFRYARRIGEKYDSKIIMATAWQHRADAVASLAALAGIAGAILGWPILDPIAAIAVAGFIAKVGGEFTVQALRELTDSTEAIDEDVRAQISQIMASLPEVKSIHLMKSRRLGGDILVEAHLVVQEDISVSEGHQVADKMRSHLFAEVKAITDVMIHIDTLTEQEEDQMPIYAGRRELQQRVEAILGDLPALDHLHAQTPHYTLRGINLDLQLVPARTASLEAIQAAADGLGHTLVQRYPDICKVTTSMPLVTVIPPEPSEPKEGR